MIARDRALRRPMQAAWDLAFAWRARRPTVHHLPIPLTALAAMAALALLRGWPLVAALALAGWVGLLRPGEILTARRADLVLPRDSCGLYPFRSADYWDAEDAPCRHKTIGQDRPVRHRPLAGRGVLSPGAERVTVARLTVHVSLTLRGPWPRLVVSPPIAENQAGVLRSAMRLTWARSALAGPRRSVSEALGCKI